MKLKRTQKGVEIIFQNDMEQKLLGLFLYHADLESPDAIMSLGLFDNLVFKDEHRKNIKQFVSNFTTAFMQLVENGRGCPDSIHLKTDLFSLYEMFPDMLVNLSFKDGIQVADLYNPMDWLLGEI